jgi:hypothetical protein
LKKLRNSLEIEGKGGNKLDNLAIVIKIKGKKAVVVTEQGTFEIIRNRAGMFIGQKILYSQESTTGRIRNTARSYYPMLAGIVALFIFVYTFYKFYYAESIYAYVNVDINPSIELAVDKNGKVQGMIPINEDAGKLIKNFKYKGLPLDNVMLSLVYMSMDGGFIDNGSSEGFILISAALDSEKSKKNDNDKKESQLTQILDNIKEGIAYSDVDVDMQFVTVPAEYRQKASENNISMGRYFIYQKALENGEEITIEELKTGKLYDLMIKNCIEPVHVESRNEHEEVLVPMSPQTSTDVINTFVVTSTPVPEHKAVEVADFTQNTFAPVSTPKSVVSETKKPNNVTGRVQQAESGANLPQKKKIKIQQYNYNAVAQSVITFLRMRIINDGAEIVDLSDVKVRYYYTVDGHKEQKFVVDWSSAGASNMTGSFVKIEDIKQYADTYLEIGFTANAGMLEPGEFVEMTSRWFKEDMSVYNQSNDYSFNTAQQFIDWKKATAYISGNLVWGVEP